MNRIESIKERLSNLGAGKIVKYDHALNLVTQYAIDYKNDVEWLMQRLERYEKALKEIAEVDNTWDDPLPTVMRRLAKEALKDEIT